MSFTHELEMFDSNRRTRILYDYNERPKKKNMYQTVLKAVAESTFLQSL